MFDQLDQMHGSPAYIPPVQGLPHPEKLHINHMRFEVSAPLARGYVSACRAYHHMEEAEECGAYLFLTGVDYDHLAAHHASPGLSESDLNEWKRGFLLGWTVCSLLLDA